MTYEFSKQPDNTYTVATLIDQLNILNPNNVISFTVSNSSQTLNINKIAIEFENGRVIFYLN